MVTVINTDGSAQPSPCTVSVPKFGKCEDLVRALSIACSLGSDETLLVAEVYFQFLTNVKMLTLNVETSADRGRCILFQVYNNCIIRYLEEPADSLTLIRDQDQLVAYRLARETDNVPLVVFMHQKLEE